LINNSDKQVNINEVLSTKHVYCRFFTKTMNEINRALGRCDEVLISGSFQPSITLTVVNSTSNIFEPGTIETVKSHSWVEYKIPVTSIIH